MLNLAVVLVLALAGLAPPQQVTVTPPKRIAAYPGVKLEIPLSIAVASGFHVQANPASRPELIPLSVRITDDAGLRVQPSLYPPGVPLRVDVEPEPINVYEGSFQVGIPVEVPGGATAGERVLHGQTRFQSCDDQHCYPPTVLPFAVTVRIGSEPPSASSRPESAHGRLRSRKKRVK